MVGTEEDLMLIICNFLLYHIMFFLLNVRKFDKQYTI